MRNLLMSNKFQAQYLSLGVQKISYTLTLDNLQIAKWSRALAPSIGYVGPNLYSQWGIAHCAESISDLTN